MRTTSNNQERLAALMAGGLLLLCLVCALRPSAPPAAQRAESYGITEDEPPGGFPVLAVVPQGKVFASMVEPLKQMKDELKAELVIISNEKSALDLAQMPITLPADVPEWLTPLVSIVPAQLFAYHLTTIKGYNPEQPRTIHKVTETE